MIFFLFGFYYFAPAGGVLLMYTGISLMCVKIVPFGDAVVAIVLVFEHHTYLVQFPKESYVMQHLGASAGGLLLD